MANPRSMVSRSLVSAASPEAEAARRKELEGRPKSLKRAGVLTVHGFATNLPAAAGALLGLRYRDWEAEYIGSGAEFTVFRTGADEALKIAHNTIFMANQEKQAYAERRQAEYLHMASWLGEFTLPQEISVAPLPFLPSRTAVQVRQPYRDIVDPHLFEPLNTDVIAENLTGLQADHPDSTDQLADFIERSRALHAAKDLIPDTNGPANLVVDGDDLRMVDGQPIGIEHFPIQQVIVGQLDSLELAIA